MINKSVMKLILVAASCALFSMASASNTENHINEGSPSSAVLKMKNLMMNDELYRMLAMLNSSMPELGAAANQASSINFQNESLAEMKKMNSQIQVTNIIALKTLQEIQELKKGASK